MDGPSNMYAEAKTWNPFKGCGFDCVYCTPSFQRQSKRQKRLCQNCYTYTPHCHEDRLSKIPSAQIIFVCGNADLSFCPPAFTRRLFVSILRGAGYSPSHDAFSSCRGDTKQGVCQTRSGHRKLFVESVLRLLAANLDGAEGPIGLTLSAHDCTF